VKVKKTSKIKIKKKRSYFRVANNFCINFVLLGLLFSQIFIAWIFIDIPKVFASPVTIVAFELNGLDGDEITFNATINDANLNTSTLSMGVGITPWKLDNGFSAKFFVPDGVKADAISNNEYFQTAISAKTNYKVSLISLDVNLRKSSTGADAYQWQYSLDGFATSGIDVGEQGSVGAGNDGLAMPQIDLSAISDLQNVTSGNAIVFRLYAWGASGLNGTFAIGRLTGDDLVFKGNVDLVTHTLTYTAGSNGSVAGTSPQTINHNSNGTEVTAVADSNYHFTTWSDGSTANPRTDTNIVSDIFAAANFEINTHTLTYTAGSNGSVAGTSPQTINHNSNGTEVTAVADSNYHFTTWSDGSTANPRTDTNIVSDISAAANFAINTHTLTYTAGSNGSVAGTSPQTINHNSNGTEVTAVADSNYHFTTWSDGSTANPRTDTNIVSDISAAANFEINNTGGGGGGGSSCCGGRVDTTPTPVVVHPPPIVQPEIQPILEPEPKLQIGPELALIVSPVIAYPVTISPNIVKNTAPAKIIPEIPEVLSVEQNQNSEPEQITAAEPTVPLETSQPSALSLGSRINAIFTAAISNIVIQSVSAVISFFKNLKWW